MRRFEKLGVFAGMPPDVQSFKYVIEGIEDRRQRFGQYDPQKINPYHGRKSDVFDCLCAVLLEHLEAQHPFRNVHYFAKTGAEIAIDFFYGDWRNSYMQFGLPCRQHPWLDTYRESMLLALLSNDLDIATRIAAYPDADTCIDDPEEDCIYSMVLGRLICGESVDQIAAQVDEIRSSRRRRPKLLLETALAWAQRDPALFRRSLREYIKHFRKSEFEHQTFIYCFSIDASILWNLARMSGLQFEALSDDEMDFIVTDQVLNK